MTQTLFKICGGVLFEGVAPEPIDKTSAVKPGFEGIEKSRIVCRIYINKLRGLGSLQAETCRRKNSDNTDQVIQLKHPISWRHMQAHNSTSY